MPNFASFPTGQTTPLPESPAENGRRPFTLIHLEIEEYCRKRDFGLQLGTRISRNVLGFRSTATLVQAEVWLGAWYWTI
jgi:hypothetical protein